MNTSIPIHPMKYYSNLSFFAELWSCMVYTMLIAAEVVDRWVESDFEVDTLILVNLFYYFVLVGCGLLNN